MLIRKALLVKTIFAAASFVVGESSPFPGAQRPNAFVRRRGSPDSCTTFVVASDSWGAPVVVPAPAVEDRSGD